LEIKANTPSGPTLWLAPQLGLDSQGLKKGAEGELLWEIWRGLSLGGGLGILQRSPSLQLGPQLINGWGALESSLGVALGWQEELLGRLSFKLYRSLGALALGLQLALHSGPDPTLLMGLQLGYVLGN